MAAPLPADDWREEDLPERRMRTIQRTPEQSQARVQRAKMAQEQKPLPTVRRLPPAYNNNEREKKGVRPGMRTAEPVSSQETISSTPAQDRINRLRNQQRVPQSASAPKKSVASYIGYIPAFAIALCKDLLDLIGIGSLPLIGWLVTFIASVLIFLSLLATDASTDIKSSRRMLRRLGILVGTIGVEGLFFGLNLLPLEIGAVVLILLLDLLDGRPRISKKILRATPVGRRVKV